jgi:hypothetical protein
MNFAEILEIFRNDVEPLFTERKTYIGYHTVRYCFCACMLAKYLNKEDKILDVGGLGIFTYLLKKLGYEKRSHVR